MLLLVNLELLKHTRASGEGESSEAFQKSEGTSFFLRFTLALSPIKAKTLTTKTSYFSPSLSTRSLLSFSLCARTRTTLPRLCCVARLVRVGHERRAKREREREVVEKEEERRRTTASSSS